MKVLIASDSPATSERLIQSEEQIDCTGIIASAEDETRITGAVDNLKPDVLILNMQILGRTGIKVLQNIRDNSSYPIVIILTDDDGLEHRRDCVEAGAHFIFDQAKESHKIKEVLTRFIQGSNVLKDSCLFDYWEEPELTI